MANTTSLQESLLAHLQRIQEDPTTPLDSKLFEQCEIFLVPQLMIDTSKPLVSSLAALLPTLQQDPAPATKLLLKLLEPYPFSAILAFEPPVDFVAGLDLSAAPYNPLTLHLLSKAATDAPSAERLATTQPEVFFALVKLWLGTEDEGIADQAGNVLYSLLQADKAQTSGISSGSAPGTEGAVWKRIFRDKDIYGLILTTCDLRSTNPVLPLFKNRKTIAQARLLDWIPGVGALDWNAITRDHSSMIASSRHDSSVQGSGSLLDFVAVRMVDYKNDVLMHRSLINFYTALIRMSESTSFQTNRAQTSSALDFMIEKGLHARTLRLYLDPDHSSHDPIDVVLLYGPAADYVATYATRYPEHFSASRDKDHILARLSSALDLSPSRWAQAESPRHDLHVLASLPRSVLLPRGPSSTEWRNSPLSMIPSKVTNADALHTLATLFHGPASETTTFPSESTMDDPTDPSLQTERSAARLLYLLYLSHNSSLWSDVVSLAETVALKDTALAAINLIAAVTTANWSVPPAPQDATPTNTLTAPIPPTLVQHFSAAPTTGTEAILTPPALTSVLPYLLRPPQTFSNLVGGRGDAESAAYQIAAAKFDVTKALLRRLNELLAQREEEGEGDALELRGMVEAVRGRVAEGVLGRGGEVGGRVGVLEL